MQHHQSQHVRLGGGGGGGWVGEGEACGRVRALTSMSAVQAVKSCISPLRQSGKAKGSLAHHGVNVSLISSP